MQAGGRRFEPGTLHLMKPLEAAALTVWTAALVCVAYWLQSAAPPSGPCNDLLTPGNSPACAAPGPTWLDGWTYYAAVAGVWACMVTVGGCFAIRLRR